MNQKFINSNRVPPLSNARKINSNKFKDLLSQMMSISSSSNIRIANSSWDIHKAPANNTNYNKPIGV